MNVKIRTEAAHILAEVYSKPFLAKSFKIGPILGLYNLLTDT
jgi:hypothetical protein